MTSRGPEGRASAERGPSFFLGSDPSPNEIEALAGDDTEIVRLEGATVMPGLIDSHVHSTGAAVYEFDHEIPEMESIADVLAYIESRAAVLEEGEWIISEEEEKGSLEPGKLADFIVLDRDILECPLEDVRHIEVRRTYLGGRLVHEAAE